MRRAGCLLCLIGLVAWPPLAHAVIVYDGNGTQNVADFATTDPRNRVGIVGTSLSGVYLGSVGGQGWVLTANHVGAGSFTLDGTVYSAVSGSVVQLTNSNGTATDLIIYRINTSLDWSIVSISGTASSVGATVTMIGNGYNRQTSLVGWDITGTTWSTTSPEGADAIGYYYAADGSRTLRWGTNTVSQVNQSVSYSGWATTCGVTRFDALDGDAQGASGDSGGGVFTQNADGTSSLAGIMLAIGTYSEYGQPANTAVVGNKTYFADLSAYRSQILTTIPEPATVPVLLGLATLGFVVVRRLRRRR